MPKSCVLNKAKRKKNSHIQRKKDSFRLLEFTMSDEEESIPSSGPSSLARNFSYNINNVYRHWIIDHVKFSEVSSKMSPIIGRDIAKRVYCLENEGKTFEAGDYFLSKLSELDDPGKYRSFVDALRDLEYSQVVKAIEGGVLEKNQAEYEKIIEIFTPTLMEKIFPTDTGQELLAREVITQEELELITKTESTVTTNKAVFQLLLAIPRRNENWYNLFLEVLYNQGYESLCNEIDPKFIPLKHENSTEQLEASLATDIERGLSSQTAMSPPVLEPIHTLENLAEFPPIERVKKCNCSCGEKMEKKFEELNSMIDQRFGDIDKRLDELKSLIQTLQPSKRPS